MAQEQNTTPVAPSEKSLAAVRDIPSARQLNPSLSVSSGAADESHASNKVAELAGLYHFSGEASDADGFNRSDRDDNVALSQQEAKKDWSRKRFRRRDGAKWGVSADQHLMSIAAKHEVWCVPGSKKTVREKWEAAHEELQQGPAVRIFAAKKKKSIESRFDHLVRKQAAKNRKAAGASGRSNTSAGDMTVDEARLEKLTMAVIDAKACIKPVTREESLKNAAKNTLGTAAVLMDSRRCGPGAGATSFGDARASDKPPLVGVLCHRNDGAGATTPGSTSGRATGQSSPATTGGTPAGVPALGDKLSLEMGVLDTDEIGKLAGATREELDLFFYMGFLVERIDRERAIKILEEVIKSRFKKVWGGKGLLEFVHDGSGFDIPGGSNVVGFGNLCLAGLCVHYGVKDDTFYAMGLKANWFVNGWGVDDVPTANEFDRLTKALASMLLDGHYSNGPLSNGGGSGSSTGSSSVLGSNFGSGNHVCAGGAGAPLGSGPSRQRRSDEGNLEGMLEQSMRESQERANQTESREDARETRKEKRKLEEMEENRKMRKIESDAERKLRAVERASAAAREDAIRKEARIAADDVRREERITADAIRREDRIAEDTIRREERIAEDTIRREERITADAVKREERIAADATRREDRIRLERKDEEDRMKQERKDERAHELAMLQMQLDLSKNSKK